MSLFNLQYCMAALSLSKSQLAVVLCVTQSTLDAWLDGKEPNPANAQRLTTILRLLEQAQVTSARPLSPRFVRQPLNEGDVLFDALAMASLHEARVAELMRAAKNLADEARHQRTQREQKLVERGFEVPNETERRERLALNMALRDWPV